MTAALLLGAAGAAFLIWKLVDWWLVRTSRSMVDDFTRRFPGRCLICSYHRYGLQHGFERNLKPAPHSCPEAAQ